ncbi:hypothetical protein H2248_001860 [Termitomyces sp. 'cryptogamus']|nr:hypothetical protein H2248_001860 [Termitomyces sp. 'cryptogamus']
MAAMIVKIEHQDGKEISCHEGNHWKFVPIEACLITTPKYILCPQKILVIQSPWNIPCSRGWLSSPFLYRLQPLLN